MTTNATTVLIAGASGMLGQKIARELLHRPHRGDREGGVRVRLLVRQATLADAAKQAAMEPLIQRGATVVEGDLGHHQSLVEATRGVDVVISAVQGGRDVVVDGQLALLDAAKQNGVRRFLPSDFSVDLFAIASGRHPLLDLRREADAAIAKSGLEYIHILNGAFTEVFLSPFFGVFDFQRGTAHYWGDGDTPVDITTTDDTARFTAEAALDASLPSGKLSVTGDVVTMKQAIAIYEEVTGRKLAARSLGTVAELEAWIASQQAAGDGGGWDVIAAQYQWGMVSGIGKLTGIANGRYPHIQPTTLRAYLAAQGA